jgi:hypothetical protein
MTQNVIVLSSIVVCIGCGFCGFLIGRTVERVKWVESIHYLRLQVEKDQRSK